MTNRLAELMEHIYYRDYDKLRAGVNSYLKEYSWDEFCGLLAHSTWDRVQEEIGFRKNIPYGKARDAMVFLMGLEPTNGIDCNMIETFRDLASDTVDDLRDEAAPIAMDKLREQLQRNTYFMDVEKMAASQYAILVEEVIEARKKEVESLSESADLTDILATYYGFKVLTTGVLLEPPDDLWSSTYRYYRRTPKNSDGITETAADAFDELCDLLDRDIDLSKDYQTLGSNRGIKKKCSEEMAHLLRHIITMAFYRAHDDRRRSMLALAESGDSRAVPFLHLKAQTVTEKNEKYLLMALRDIGHPSSFDILKDYLSHEKWRLKEIALEAMGMYSCEEASRIILEKLDSDRITYRRGALNALGYRKRDVSVDKIEPSLSNPKYVMEAIQALINNTGQKGKQAILHNKDTIWSCAAKCSKPKVLLQTFRNDDDLRPMLSGNPLHHVVPFLEVEFIYDGYKPFRNAIQILSNFSPEGERALAENTDKIWDVVAKHGNPKDVLEMLDEAMDIRCLFLLDPATACKSLVSIIKTNEKIEKYKREKSPPWEDRGKKYGEIASLGYQYIRKLTQSIPLDMKEEKIAGLANCLGQSLLDLPRKYKFLRNVKKELCLHPSFLEKLKQLLNEWSMYGARRLLKTLHLKHDEKDSLFKRLYRYPSKLATLKHESSVLSVVWHPDGEKLITTLTQSGQTSPCKYAIIWDPKVERKLVTLEKNNEELPYGLAWSPDGTKLTNRCENPTNSVHILDVATGKANLVLDHDNDVVSVAWGPDSDLIAVGSWVRDGSDKVHIWDARTGRKLHTLNHGDDKGTRAVWSPDGSRIATQSRIWDTKTGEELFQLKHEEKIIGVTMSHDGTKLATQSQNAVIIWDTQGWEKIHVLEHDWALSFVRWSPDDTRILTGDYYSPNAVFPERRKLECHVAIWDIETGQKEMAWKHDGRMRTPKWHPDGELIAIGMFYDATAWIIDARTGEKLAVMEHDSTVLCVAWSPDGTMLATGSEDNTAAVWDTSNVKSSQKLTNK